METMKYKTETDWNYSTSEVQPLIKDIQKEIFKIW